MKSLKYIEVIFVNSECKKHCKRLCKFGKLSCSLLILGFDFY